MSNIDQYIATSVEHIKRQLGGGAHGRYPESAAVKRQLATTWPLLRVGK